MRFDADGPVGDQATSEQLSWSLGWKRWLAREGLTAADITASMWTLDAGVTKLGETNVDGVTSVLITIDDTATRYRLDNTITAGSLKKTASIWIERKS